QGMNEIHRRKSRPLVEHDADDIEQYQKNRRRDRAIDVTTLTDPPQQPPAGEPSNHRRHPKSSETSGDWFKNPLGTYNCDSKLWEKAKAIDKNHRADHAAEIERPDATQSNPRHPTG